MTTFMLIPWLFADLGKLPFAFGGNSSHGLGIESSKGYRRGHKGCAQSMTGNSSSLECIQKP